MEKIYGLIGKSLGHSFSAAFFKKKFGEENLTHCVYRNFEIDNLASGIPALKANPNLQGLNVTIPYKTAILDFVDDVSAEVEAMRAGNCIRITNGKWKAFNTDVIGFEQSFAPLLKAKHEKALVLGTGGASAAVQFVLNKLGIPFHVVSRTAGTAVLPYQQIDEAVLQDCKIIINTTPLGMFPATEDAPPLPYEALSAEHYLYDLIYNPRVTKFLQYGINAGSTIKNGEEMLVIQAEESWKIWNR